MSALDDAITVTQVLRDRLDASRSAADHAVDATSDALDAATAFGASSHIETLVEVHDSLADATRTLGAAAEQSGGAVDKLLALRGDAASGTGVSTPRSSQQGGQRARPRRRASRGVTKPRPTAKGEGDALDREEGGWRSWGEPSDHVATLSPKVVGYGVTVAGIVGVTQGVVAGLTTATGVLVVDLTATVYEKAKAAKRRREKGD